MKTDAEIQADVKDEFRWEPKIADENIKVEVNDGHVKLSGVVDSYPKKIDAERAAMRVSGVYWVTNEIVVNVAEKRSDDEIREAAIRAITWNSNITKEQIDVNVDDGWVTLEGEVTWEYQKTKARNLTEDVAGVVGITNLISVVSPLVTKEK
jgi:osmotically-inducible protein OsmY